MVIVPREEGSLFPLDGELNLPKDSYSHRLRERLAFEVARGSFDEAVRAMETTTGGQVPKRQAEELTAKVSQDFEAFYQHRARQGPEETLDPLVMSEDGKGIVMRREDLREGTKRAAERDSHKLKTRLSPGEKRARKRMATVSRRCTACRAAGSKAGVGHGRDAGGRRAQASSAQQTGVGQRCGETPIGSACG